MLGKRISELRAAFGWNQVQLAERLNISKQTVSNWENENIFDGFNFMGYHIMNSLRDTDTQLIIELE